MDVFEALAQPTRRSIVEMLAQSGQLSASQIAASFEVTPAAISQHLKILREAHAVRMHKRRQQRIYEVDPQAMRSLEQWARQMTRVWEQRLDALEKLVQSEDPEADEFRGEKESDDDEGE